MTDWNIGTDICDIEKFQRYSISKHAHFYQRVFTPQEIDYCMQFSSLESHFAGIFAAKESVFKALNQFGKINLSEIEISHNENGTPKIIFNQPNDKSINKIQFNDTTYNVKVSISHSKNHSIAFAIACNQTTNLPMKF